MTATMRPLPGTSRERYPIASARDVEKAVRATGRTDPAKRPAVRRHIIEQARRLGCTHLIPDSWNSDGTLKNLSATERERLLELAGRWKHNWIPLDAIAAAIKAKQMKGDGVRRPRSEWGITSRPAGKTRFDVQGARQHAALTSGVRGKSRPPSSRGARAAAPSTDTPDQLKAKAAEAVRLPRAELTARALKGDPVARAELDRRAAKKGTPEHIRKMDVRQMRAELTGKNDTPASEKATEATSPAPVAPAPPPEAPKRTRKPSALHAEYRELKRQQDLRVEAATRGALHAGVGGGSKKDSEEVLAYFGEGEHMGVGVEPRLTYRRFLEERRSGTAHQKASAAAYDAGVKLGRKHAAEPSSAQHDAEFAAVEAQHHADHRDMVAGGYNDGVIAGEAAKTKREAAQQYKKARGAADRASTRANGFDAPVNARNPQVEAHHKAAATAHAEAGRVALQAGDRNTAAHHLAQAQGHIDRSNAAAKAREQVAQETPEQTAARIGMTFPKPTVKGHTIVGEGATVERTLAPPTPGHVVTPDQARRLAPLDVVNTRTGARNTIVHVSDQNIAIRSSDGHVEAHPITGHITAERILSSYTHPQPGANAKPAGVRDMDEAELRRMAAGELGGSDRLKVNADLELARRGRPALGDVVTARQPGVENPTLGVVSGYRPNGGLEVSYKDRHDNTVRGVFNPAHVTKRSGERLPAHRGRPATAAFEQANAEPSTTVTAQGNGFDAVTEYKGVKYRRSGGGAFYTQPDKGKGEMVTSLALQKRLEASHFAAVNEHMAQRNPSVGESRRFGEAANAGQRADIGQAQAAARAEATRATPPKQGEMFGTHGEQQPDMFDQAATGDNRGHPLTVTAGVLRATKDDPNAPAQTGYTVRHSGNGIKQGHLSMSPTADANGNRWQFTNMPGQQSSMKFPTAEAALEDQARRVHAHTVGGIYPYGSPRSTYRETPGVSTLTPRAEQTPRQIHDRLQRDPSKVSYEELRRLRALGGRFGAAAEDEQRRRNMAADQKARAEGVVPYWEPGGQTIPGTIAHTDRLAAEARAAAAAAPTPGSSRANIIAGSRLQVGDRVRSEFGSGHVTEATDRSIVYKLDSGESLRVQRGTPGYDRVEKVTRLEGNQSVAVTGPNAGKVTDTPAASSAPAGIRVEHSGDGTVVYGTERGDEAARSALKAQGFKWSRSLNGWYLPRTWSASTRELRVRGLEARLGDRVTVERGDLAKSGTAAERAAERTARAEELAQRHTQRAERAATEADVRFGRAHQIGDMIPMGQPILVGHHSEGRHRRDLERIDTNMRAGISAQQQAESEAERARSSAARAAMQTDPRAAARRLARSEAELRKVERRLTGTGKEIHGENTPASGDYRTRLEARARELRDEIAHDRSIAGELVASGSAAKFGKHNVKPGDVVKVGGRGYVVHSTGPKNAKAMTEVGPLPYAYSQIQGVGKLDDVNSDALRKLLKRNRELEGFGAGNTRKLSPAIISRIEAILRDRGEGVT